MAASDGIISVTEYIDCIKKIQISFPDASCKQVLGDLRRLYYSGLAFTLLIPDSQRIGSQIPWPAIPGRPPVTNKLEGWEDKLTLAKLKLKANENGVQDNPSPYIAIANGNRDELIDVGHLLLTFDARVNGNAHAPYSTYDIENIDIASWIADISIAAYWREYINKYGKKKIITDAEFIKLDGPNPNALRNKMLSKPTDPTDEDFFQYSAPDSDLLGDIDGFVIKQLFDQNQNITLSNLFYRFYASPSGRFVDKRFWFFCFLNELNYDYGTENWESIDYIFNKYLPRIDRCIDLFNDGYAISGSNAISTYTAPFSNVKPKKNQYPSSKVFLQKFLYWLKPKLQDELKRTLGTRFLNRGRCFHKCL